MGIKIISHQRLILFVQRETVDYHPRRCYTSNNQATIYSRDALLLTTEKMNHPELSLV